MSTLPTGTVAMLFSDIEGSTGLLIRLGSTYAEALDAMRLILRQAWTDHGGIELGTEGDSFFVVFAAASDAVAAASESQRRLAEYSWPGNERVRVRMGIHTGSPALHDGSYIGKDVHRAARIAAAAHGGQVVLSEATASLVQEDLPDGDELMDLGTHQLKDIPRPEHLFELIVDGLQAEFPPLKTVGAVSVLPSPSTPLVGRDKELAELVDALAASRMRLVTVTGPGGSGKTRLAIEVAHHLVNNYPDGVYFVPLVSLTTADGLWTAVAEVLDLRLPDPSAAKIVHYLGRRKALLVLDNLEQLQGASAVVAQLLEQAPRLSILATSRRPLHVAAEYEHALVPLDLPEGDSFDAAERSGAVRLFVQQAQRIRASFRLTPANAGDIAALCRRLDGLPLALEIAAARTKLLSPHALLSRLDQALALDMRATGPGPDRHRTLRDTIAWSEKLLSPPLQDFFHRMGVFGGGADLPAIAAVALPESDEALSPDEAESMVLDLVSDLVDASMLTVRETADGEPRIGMLQTLRIYTREEMRRTGEYADVRARHARYYLVLGEQISLLLTGTRRVQARTKFELEHDNFLGALGWALPREAPPDRNAERIQAGLRLCLALNGFWTANGYLSEARRWLQRAADRADGQESSELARCLSLLARKQRNAGEFRRAHETASRALEMARRVDDPNRAAELLALSSLASLETILERPAEARRLHEEAISLARDSGDEVALWGALVDFAALESAEHNYERSWDLASEAHAIARRIGHAVGELIAQHNMAWASLRTGRIDEAEHQMRTVILSAIDLDEEATLLPLALDYAVVLAELGRHQAAVRLLGASDAGYEQMGGAPDPIQGEDRHWLIETTQSAMSIREWDEAYRVGQAAEIEEALREAVTPMDAQRQA